MSKLSHRFFAWCNFGYMPNQSTGDPLNFLTLYKPGDMAGHYFSVGGKQFQMLVRYAQWYPHGVCNF
ncbi:hypothetical protein [Gallionella capsiferriformans]|nr:hypothetical protein [Gallionella capsiferriformans]